MAWIYNLETMLANIKQAHTKLDEAIKCILV